MRVVQIKSESAGRRVALVDEPQGLLLSAESVDAMAHQAFSFGPQFELDDGDLMRVIWDQLRRRLVNSLVFERRAAATIPVQNFPST